MSLASGLRGLLKLVNWYRKESKLHHVMLSNLMEFDKGAAYSREWPNLADHGTMNRRVSKTTPVESSNPLQRYFDSHKDGKGLWKWTHYFEVYDRHFSKFRGSEVHVLEVGVFRGGSLEMWKTYFGPYCRVYGVDIQSVCKTYEDDRTRIFIGDQADRRFWKTVREQIPALDIVIDDGSHLPDQQKVTLEEMLPHLRAGGVYICEDIHRLQNRFAAYVFGLADHLNATQLMPGDMLKASPTNFQRVIHSVHLYPFIGVIEKRDYPVEEYLCPRRGTEWQPFL